MSMSILNISAYKFVALDDLAALRARVVERCDALALKGTILLAPEGINLFLAAPADAVREKGWGRQHLADAPTAFLRVS